MGEETGVWVQVGEQKAQSCTHRNNEKLVPVNSDNIVDPCQLKSASLEPLQLQISTMSAYKPPLNILLPAAAFVHEIA